MISSPCDGGGCCIQEMLLFAPSVSMYRGHICIYMCPRVSKSKVVEGTAPPGAITFSSSGNAM